MVIKNVNTIMIPSKSGIISKCLKGYTEEKHWNTGDLRLETDGHSEWWENQHLYITTKDSLGKNDWCMFYNQVSKVLEVNETHAKIETRNLISESDAELINSIKGLGTVKEGDYGTMIHSFTLDRLPKIIASTDKTLIIKTTYLYPQFNLDKTPIHEILPKISKGFIEKYCECNGKGNFTVECKNTEWYNKRFGGTWQPFPDNTATLKRNIPILNEYKEIIYNVL